MSKIFKNQISDSKQYGKLVREAHLGWLGMTDIQKVGDIERLIDLDIGANNFVNFVESLPAYELNEEGPYRYAMQGIEERNYPLVKATIDAAGTTVITDNHRAGYKGASFYLWFEDDVFSATGVLTSNHPEQIMLRIMGDGVQVGLHTRYQVQLMAEADSNLFVPADEVDSGTRWVENYGLVEQELSTRGTDLTFAGHFELTNQTSVIRKNYEVPGNMILKGVNQPLVWSFVADNGQRFDRWLGKLDYEFFTQFRRDKARLMMYGKSLGLNGMASQIKGESGNTVKAGMGLYEFMNSGNIKYYNQFDIDVFTKFILDITYNMVGQSQRKIVVSTGEYGLYEFHKALMNKAATYPWAQSSHNFKISGNKISLMEGQMVNFGWINGIEISVMLDKMKDNPIHNMQMHPDGGPVTSRIFDIYDFGTTNGKPNIQRLKVKGYEELYRYIPGMRDPFSAWNNMTAPGMAASSKDGYSVFKQWVGGLHMGNPKKTGRFIPTLYQL
jgi:hypothetical protein